MRLMDGLLPLLFTVALQSTAREPLVCLCRPAVTVRLPVVDDTMTAIDRHEAGEFEVGTSTLPLMYKRLGYIRLGLADGQAKVKRRDRFFLVHSCHSWQEVWARRRGSVHPIQ